MVGYGNSSFGIYIKPKEAVSLSYNEILRRINEKRTSPIKLMFKGGAVKIPCLILYIAKNHFYLSELP